MHAPAPDVATALLITDEDCRIEDFDLSGLNVCATAALSCTHLRSPRAVVTMVEAFERAALADAAARRALSLNQWIVSALEMRAEADLNEPLQVK